MTKRSLVLVISLMAFQPTAFSQPKDCVNRTGLGNSLDEWGIWCGVDQLVLGLAASESTASGGEAPTLEAESEVPEFRPCDGLTADNNGDCSVEIASLVTPAPEPVVPPTVPSPTPPPIAIPTPQPIASPTPIATPPPIPTPEPKPDLVFEPQDTGSMGFGVTTSSLTTTIIDLFDEGSRTENSTFEYQGVSAIGINFSTGQEGLEGVTIVGFDRNGETTISSIFADPINSVGTNFNEETGETTGTINVSGVVNNNTNAAQDFSNISIESNEYPAEEIPTDLILVAYWTGGIGSTQLSDQLDEESGTLTLTASQTETQVVYGNLTPLENIEQYIAQSILATYTGITLLNDQNVRIDVDFAQETFNAEFTDKPGSESNRSFSAEGVITGQHIISTSVSTGDGFVQGAFFGPNAEAVGGSYEVTNDQETYGDVFITTAE